MSEECVWISVTYSSSVFLFLICIHAEQVCEWRSPEQLKELLDLELRDKGESVSKILQYCRDAIKYSVKTSKSLNTNTDILSINFIFFGCTYKSTSSWRSFYTLVTLWQRVSDRSSEAPSGWMCTLNLRPLHRCSVGFKFRLWLGGLAVCWKVNPQFQVSCTLQHKFFKGLLFVLLYWSFLLQCFC